MSAEPIPGLTAPADDCITSDSVDEAELCYRVGRYVGMTGDEAIWLTYPRRLWPAYFETLARNRGWI